MSHLVIEASVEFKTFDCSTNDDGDRSRTTPSGQYVELCTPSPWKIVSTIEKE